MNTRNGLSPLGARVRTALAALLIVSLLFVGGCSVLGGQRDETATSTPGYGGGEVAVEPSKAPGTYGYDTGAAQDLSVASPEASSDSAARTAGSATTAEQLMIRTADMRIQVKEVDDSVDRLRTLTKQFGGLVEYLQVSSEEQTPIYRPMDASGMTSDATPLAAYATVRVPSERFDAFLTKVATLGKVLVQSESGQDVTQQHIDMTARLKTLQAEELRLREFLESAKTVTDMLAVESELSRVRSEIESLQAQLDYLDKQIAMSALTVELVRPTPVVQPAGTDWGFTDALRNGIRGAVTVLTGMITILISLLPLIILVTLIVVAWIAIARSRRRRRAAAGETEGATDAGAENQEPADEVDEGLGDDVTAREQTHE